LSSQKVNGSDFVRMMLFAAERLQSHVEQVNALNVFPVPDGDTGTNMNLTLSLGVQEMQKKADGHLGRTAEALAKGLLMGARGNSGVILSQLFRGFAKTLAPHAEADAKLLAQAFAGGVETAYKAVVKPVEGTILTVARESAETAVKTADREEDLARLMDAVIRTARESLARTPEQLPILKQVGVVDAGGQGLIFIYEGFHQALKDPNAALSGAAAAAPAAKTAPAAPAGHASERRRIAQAHIATEEIEFGYCTEFIVQLHDEGRAKFDEHAFRNDLSEHGDSMVVVADDDLVKVHIHAEYPGNVLNLAMQYGSLTRIKIDNMREQHTEILSHEGGHAHADVHGEPDGPPQAEPKPETAGAAKPAADAPRKPMGMVAVAVGDGLSEVFHSVGVDVMLSGGQTMNPSTEEIVTAIQNVPADTVFVLPNNSNIIMAARQAAELADRNVVVIPTKTIPQGLSAALAFNEFADAETNAKAMEEAAGRVRSGSVTYAVRDSAIDGLEIREGDYLGMLDSQIAASGPNLDEVVRGLLERMIESGDEIVTVFAGQDADEAHTGKLAAWLEERYPDAELELHRGGQPLYYYLISVEG
jgi:hypothetical protein